MVTFPLKTAWSPIYDLTDVKLLVEFAVLMTWLAERGAAGRGTAGTTSLSLSESELNTVATLRLLLTRHRIF